MMIPRVGLSDFVQRQTPQSDYAHFEGSWEELLTLVESQWEQRKISPHHSQVLKIPVPQAQLHRFYTSVVEINANTKLQAEFKPRRPGEDAFAHIFAVQQEKQRAQSAEIILYSHQVLEQDGEAPQPQTAEFYIISINAYASPQPEPMHPVTMARNLLGLKGGTRPEVPYSPEAFAEAIFYWAQHAKVKPETNTPQH